MDKKKKDVRRIKRIWVQLGAAVLANGYIPGFLRGKIYTGQSKRFCFPGLNCYSCPGALGACPIGSLQAVMGSRSYKISLYVTGFLMIVGALVGRLVCGWLCPFGLVQDLVYKIPFVKKMKNIPGHKILIWAKYVFLVVFVILLPLFVVDITGLGKPWFCQYICPSGTLTAGIPLVLANSALRQAIGFLFAWKVAILVVILVLSVLFYRPFCKYICPLGAIYGMFNGIALYGYQVEKSDCVQCGKCQNVCKMDIKVWQQPNSQECIRCGDCIQACPTGAIHKKSFR